MEIAPMPNSCLSSLYVPHFDLYVKEEHEVDFRIFDEDS
jgi:hypothetical protein